MDLSKLNRRTFLQASAAAGLAAGERGHIHSALAQQLGHIGQGVAAAGRPSIHRTLERIPRAFPIHVAHMGGVKRG